MWFTERDVFGNDPAAKWVHNRIRSYGLSVQYRNDLGSTPYAADSRTGEIWLPDTVRDLKDAHRRLDRCVLYLAGGSEFAPEFVEVPERPAWPKLAATTPGAVIPFPILRRAW